jgi:hypothetical protein
VTISRDPLEVAIVVAAAFDQIGILHTVGGSIAASVAGEPRSTIDIDFVVQIEHPHVDPLFEALCQRFYVDRSALHRAIETHGSANLIDQITQIKVDLFVAGGTPLDSQQLARRQRVEVSPGQALFMHPPEDILLQKLRWYGKGAGVSDRQWRDILGIIRTQGERLDRNYLAANAPILDVTELLRRAIAEAD